ncbi:MAG: hypothetical protein HOO96_07195 [Polyangiaceae bacterium]|nr:hypothetical protein [Polyangiaceae bacterium]
MKRRTIGGLTVMACVFALLACPRPPHLGDGLPVAAVPVGFESEYQLFAARCSKCHALSRALGAAPKDDEYWKVYVTRMRRQPQSGISPEDEPPILRFLHAYSVRRDPVEAGAEAGAP